MKKIILENKQCPGDVMCLTAAVESLHSLFPGRYLTDVRTTAWEIWQHNPRISQLCSDDPDVEVIRAEYPAVHRSNSEPITMIEAMTEHLEKRLGIGLRCMTNRPVVYLSDEEKGWVDQVTEITGTKTRFWLVNAGSKNDFPLKQWPVEYYQEVVNRTRGLITWVQIGSLEHNHPELTSVIDLRGKTDTRQLIRLAWHAAGGLGPITFLMHLMAAHRKPYVCLAGGREPVQWIAYPTQTTLHTIGSLSCCATSACWKSKVLASQGENSCDKPVFGLSRLVGKCMAQITPDEVVPILRRHLCEYC